VKIIAFRGLPILLLAWFFVIEGQRRGPYNEFIDCNVARTNAINHTYRAGEFWRPAPTLEESKDVEVLYLDSTRMWRVGRVKKCFQEKKP
jgi:hypothetical protein